MKRTLALLLLSLFASMRGALAQGPGADEQYVQIYSLIQQADNLRDRGQFAVAKARYLEAQTALKKFQADHPDWNVNVVKYRLGYLASRIAQTSTNIPPAETATNTPAPATPPEASNAPPAAAGPETVPPVAATPPPAAVPPPAAAAAPEADNQLPALQEQVRRLESEKSLLEAKLKEALAAQPAAVDPRELEKSEERVRELQKENEVLKVTLNDAQNARAPTNSSALDTATRALADATARIAQLTESNATLALEKEALQTRVKAPAAPAAPDEATLALRAENEILKKQVADLKSQAAAAPNAEDLGRKLAEAQTQIAALQSDKEILRLEKVALENQAKQLAAAPPPPAPAPDTKALEAARSKEEELNGQLIALRARIDVLEARPLPLSPDELSAMKEPPTALVAAMHAPARGTNTATEPPAGAEALRSDAQRFFMAREFDKAEEKYLEVLKLDEKNVFTLANLATIEIELNHLDDAEKHLRQALAVDPTDAYSLGTLGRLKIQQGQYDEALDLLSRAAQISPDNAEIQNYLGIALSHKGLRGPAETALRKAIQIEPGYGPAHNNLAVIYITQNPPLVELARWHYQKAREAGHPANPELEKLLEKAAAAAPQKP